MSTAITSFTFTALLASRSILPIDEALTFAQVNSDNTIKTVLVLKQDEARIEAVDVGAALAMPGQDPLAILRSKGVDAVRSLATRPGPHRQFFSREAIRPSGGSALHHVAAGINYREHGQEVDLGDVFLFPKIAPATSAQDTLSVYPSMLFDYEVEIAARFDRDIRTLEDFDQATIGFFLSGDMTDRAVQLRKMNKRNPSAGVGFTDAKSGPQWFPTGPYLVVPRDWRTFLKRERIGTRVNQSDRQSGIGSDMVLDLRQLVEKALREGAEPRWTYRDELIPLIVDAQLPAGTCILTGTPGGVVLRPPTTWQKISSLLRWAAGGFFTHPGPLDFVVEEHITRLHGQRIFLKDQDEVHFASDHLGDIRLKVRAE